MHRTDREVAAVGCVLFLFYLLVVGGCLALSAVLFQYNLWHVVARDIPWYGDLLGGLLPINVPAAIICFILDLCGVPVPYVQLG